MFNQNADKTLERAKNSTVQHDRRLTLAIFVDELSTETLWQHEIKLNRTALPYTADAVAQREFNLRTVERTFTRLEFPVEAGVVKSIFQSRFSFVPKRFFTDTTFRTGGKFHLNRVKAEVFVDVQSQLDEIRSFLTDLAVRAEDVCIILSEATHTHNAVQRTGWLITVAATKLSQTQWQFTVRFQPLVEHLDMTWAVHRLYRVAALLGLSSEHGI